MEIERLLVYCSLVASYCTPDVILFPQTEQDIFLLECITEFGTNVGTCVPPCRTAMSHTVGAGRESARQLLSWIIKRWEGKLIILWINHQKTFSSIYQCCPHNYFSFIPVIKGYSKVSNMKIREVWWMLFFSSFLHALVPYGETNISENVTFDVL